MQGKELLLPVILSGGAGTRLWPVAGPDLPKPFVRLPDGRSLLQHAFARARAVAPGAPVLLVTGRQMLDGTMEQWRDMPAQDGDRIAQWQAGRLSILAESDSRDTAVAFVLAALDASGRHGPDTVLFLMPADQLIRDTAGLAACVKEGAELAASGKPVLVGIRPSGPSTAFGYLEVRDGEVRRFVEKPSAEAAIRMISQPGTFWNSGMLLCRAGTILELCERFHPDLLEACRGIGRSASVTTIDDVPVSWLNLRPLRSRQCRSLDRMILERLSGLGFVEGRFDWLELGSWERWNEVMPVDAHGNASAGPAFFHESSRCFVHSSGRRVATIGLEDVVIVDSGDEVLVASRGSAQKVRTLREFLDAGREAPLEPPPPPASAGSIPAHGGHGREQRPWGAFEILAEGPGYKVKRLVVHPGARLSLQSHRHRSEHWLVVAGIGQANLGGAIRRLSGGVSVDVARGQVHRLANTGDAPLVVIETQQGDYLGEDDEIRYQDDYGRVTQGSALPKRKRRVSRSASVSDPGSASNGDRGQRSREY